MKFMDLTGQQYNRLTVISRDGDISPVKWNCVCDCGQHISVQARRLRTGNTKSCGCYYREIIASPKRHGHASVATKGLSPTYRTWASMVTRCTRPGSKESYAKYGARGITVCDRWLDFVYFLEDMGERPQGKTLDRIDGTKGYEPSNCRWATPVEQARNRRQPMAHKRNKGWKINREIAGRIVERHKLGEKQKKIARDFNISSSMVFMIVNKKCWS